MISVSLYAAARAAAGGVSSVESSACDLAELIAELGERHGPQMVRVLGICSFLVNGVAAHGDPCGIPLSAGDTVDVLPPFAGG